MENKKEYFWIDCLFLGQVLGPQYFDSGIFLYKKIQEKELKNTDYYPAFHLIHEGMEKIIKSYIRLFYLKKEKRIIPTSDLKEFFSKSGHILEEKKLSKNILYSDFLFPNKNIYPFLSLDIVKDVRYSRNIFGDLYLKQFEFIINEVVSYKEKILKEINKLEKELKFQKLKI